LYNERHENRSARDVWFLAEILRYGILAVSVEDVVEAGLQRGSQRSVVAGPEPFHTRCVRFLGHLQNMVALLQVEGIAHNVQPFSEHFYILCASGTRGFLYQEYSGAETASQMKYGAAFETPAEPFGGVLTIVIVEAEISINRSQQNAGHGQRLRLEGFGRDARSVLCRSTTLACSRRPSARHAG